MNTINKSTVDIKKTTKHQKTRREQLITDKTFMKNRASAVVPLYILNGGDFSHASSFPFISLYKLFPVEIEYYKCYKIILLANNYALKKLCDVHCM